MLDPMYVYDNIQYSNRAEAMQAIQADEALAREDLKKSKMIFVASIVLTLVFPLFFFSDVLGFTQSTPQTKFCTAFAFGYFLWDDQQRGMALLNREERINQFFQEARDQLPHG